MYENAKPSEKAIECPRCGERNVIQHSCSKCRYDLESRQSNESGQRRKGKDILLIIGLYAVIVLMVMKVSHDVYQSNAASRQLNAGQQSPRELLLGGSRFSQSSNMLLVQGTVWNNTNRAYASVQVPIYVFCGNDQVHVCLAEVGDLPPGARSAFLMSTKIANIEETTIAKPFGRLVRRSAKIR
ncbi:MAG: FxLYD domain-containing protein [Armatimonadota bacterium]